MKTKIILKLFKISQAYSYFFICKNNINPMIDLYL